MVKIQLYLYSKTRLDTCESRQIEVTYFQTEGVYLFLGKYLKCKTTRTTHATHAGNFNYHLALLS